MKEKIVKKKKDDKAMGEENPQHRIHLPGFLIEREIGLGDVIKRATSSLGIRPCRGCERRAVALNRWMTFSR